MIRYVFKDGGTVAIKNGSKADPQKIGEALADIAAKHDGELKPVAVVFAAEDERSVLHKHFEWDDAEAAYKFRLDQARDLIALIRVDDEIDTEPVRAFLSVKDNGDNTSYRTVGEVRNSAHLQSLVLRQADRDLASFQARYRELADICEVISEARAKIAARRPAETNQPSA